MHAYIYNIVPTLRIENEPVNRFEISPVFDLRVSRIAQHDSYQTIFFRNVVSRIIDVLRNSRNVEFSGSFSVGGAIWDIAGYVNLFDKFISCDP